MEVIYLFLIFLSPFWDIGSSLIIHKMRIPKLGIVKETREINSTKENKIFTSRFTNEWSYDTYEASSGLDIDEENRISECFEEPKKWCNTGTKYRSIDGYCNNLHSRTWGRSHTALIRVASASYNDGKAQIKQSTDREKDLPNPRRISTMLFDSNEEFSELQTNFVMQFGQIIAQDTSGVVNKQNGNTSYNCCEEYTDEKMKEACYPIFVDKKDKFYSKYKKTCQNFIRSKTTDDIECPMKPVYQINTVTSFLDMSFLYGSTDDMSRKLRSNNRGKLKIRITKDKRPFPRYLKSELCTNNENRSSCYEFGDMRVNQNLGMTTSIIVFVRVHNFICDMLSWLNVHWNDEKIFQEARRIQIAMYQHIIYYEYLPIIIGVGYAKKYELLPTNDGFTNDYYHKINPSTINSFTAAIFRTLHTIIPSNFLILNEERVVESAIPLSSTYFNVSNYVETNYDGLLRGLATSNGLKHKRFATPQVSNLLYRKNEKYGLDLISFDIQRGRDHGLPSYNGMRDICGFSKASRFDEFKHVMKQESINILEELYDDVNDIDLYVGASLEIPEEGALVGPLSQCIIAEAFYRWKCADRFFYQHGYLPGSFTTDQLKQIRKSSLSLMICMGSDNIKSMQSNSFYKPSELNPLIPCELIPRLDFSWWKENDN